MTTARLALGALLLFPLGAAGQQPKFETSCVLRNHSYILAHYDKENKKLDEKEQDDYTVTCTITYKNGILYKEVLPLPHPTEFRDAMLATEEFNKRKSVQLIKDWRQHGTPKPLPKDNVPEPQGELPE